VRDRIDPRAIALIVGGLAALIATIGLGGGFIAATTILFAVTSAAFGRRAIHIDLAIGLVLALSIYLLFDKLLALSLPAGPLERLL
ncbi:MAG: tripartite tricarboxylate transporter TctB family protein, partial [Solimonas sp.]